MSLTLTDINAYTLDMIVPNLQDITFKQSPVLTRVLSRNRRRYPGGLLIQQPLMHAELNGGVLGRGQPMDITYKQTATAMQTTLKVYWVNITLFAFDSLQNAGDAAVINQVNEKFQNAFMSMAKLLGTNIYLNSVAPRQLHMTGFEQWYDDGNEFPVVAGVTRADIMTVGTVGGLNAYTATLTDFTIQALRTAYGQAWYGNNYVDLIPATQAGFNLIEETQQPLQRWNDVGPTDVAKIGFQTLRYQAAEVVVDQYMPTGTNGRMYGVNSNFLDVYMPQHELFNFGFTGFKVSSGSIDHAGQHLAAIEPVVTNPRTGWKLKSNQF